MAKKAENLNLGNLSEALAEALGTPKGKTRQELANVFEQVVKAVKGGAKVSIYGVGTFKKVTRKARTGRNPKTGEKIKVAASSTMGFKAAPSLKKAFSGKK